jgi:DNA modification methylase
VFREVRRVLREDGVVFLNLGDSYAQAKGAGDVGLKPKDLVGIPWRVAFALQADGWYLRADIIWSKGNCMPESVTDRPTKSHEYVFLLSKSAQYFYDSEAIKEPSVTGDTRKPYGSDGAWAMDGRNKWEEGKGQQRDNADGTKRNKRSVWTINSKPYKGAHFAVMPSELASECIKVGSSEKGCCSKCGKPLERIINISKDARAFSRDQSKEQSSARRADGSRLTSGTGHRTINGVIPSYKSPEVSTLCWELSCSCQESFIPCLVLDPFAGSGTTLAAAACLGRSYVGIEINQQYEKFIESRLRPVIEDRNQRESFELMMGLEHCDRD